MATLRGLKVSGPLSDHFFRKDAVNRNALLRWVCIVPMINLNLGLDQAINGGSGDIFTFILGPPEAFPVDRKGGGPPRQSRIRLSTPVENTTKTRSIFCNLKYHGILLRVKSFVLRATRENHF